MKYLVKENTITIDPEGKYLKKTVDDFLNDYYQSKKNKYLLLLNKQILLDGNTVKHGKEIIDHKTITITLPEEAVDWIPAETECKVVYEDAFIYIVHKDAGMIIHSDPSDTTCLNAYAARYQINHGIKQPVRPIHRLDKDTVGLVIYSKIPFFQPWFDAQLSSKRIHRHYLAITNGNIDPSFRMTINKPLGRDRHNSGMYRVSSTGVEIL